MEAYRVVEWKQRYEVTEKGKAANADTPIENLRKSPLPYVRFKVYGHAHGPAYRKIVRRAWVDGQAMELAVFGLFGKLLELAANQTREYRGWILNEKQKPMIAADIAEALDVQDRKSVKRALEILTDPAIGWVEILEFPISPQLSPNDGGTLLGKEGDACGGKLLNETKAKGKGKENEGKETPASNGEASDLPTNDTASVSSEVRKKELFAYDVICKIVRPKDKSDQTTLQHIFKQLKTKVQDGIYDVGVFKEVEEAARGCIDADNRIAMFVSVAKERFGYQPKRERILRKAAV